MNVIDTISFQYVQSVLKHPLPEKASYYNLVEFDNVFLFFFLRPNQQASIHLL